MTASETKSEWPRHIQEWIDIDQTEIVDFNAERIVQKRMEDLKVSTSRDERCCRYVGIYQRSTGTPCYNNETCMFLENRVIAPEKEVGQNQPIYYTVHAYLNGEMYAAISQGTFPVPNCGPAQFSIGFRESDLFSETRCENLIDIAVTIYKWDGASEKYIGCSRSLLQYVERDYYTGTEDCGPIPPNPEPCEISIGPC